MRNPRAGGDPVRRVNAIVEPARSARRPGTDAQCRFGAAETGSNITA
jgi:hypothetical protein